jgi:hypothetical protein
MAHFSACLAFTNGLVKPCARHDSNVRPLPPQGSALSPELRARERQSIAASVNAAHGEGFPRCRRHHRLVRWASHERTRRTRTDIATEPVEPVIAAGCVGFPTPAAARPRWLATVLLRLPFGAVGLSFLLAFVTVITFIPGCEGDRVTHRTTVSGSELLHGKVHHPEQTVPGCPRPSPPPSRPRWPWS